MRDRILREARRLAITQGTIPSLNAVAEAAGVSKGGLIHHFPTRDALIDGLGREALAEVDQAMRDAASRGQAAVTWLRLSVPNAPEREIYRALATMYQTVHVRRMSLVDEAAMLTDEWEALIAAELGDLNRARVVRLVGDGLLANAMIATDLSVSDADIAALLAVITGPEARE